MHATIHTPFLDDVQLQEPPSGPFGNARVDWPGPLSIFPPPAAPPPLETTIPTPAPACITVTTHTKALAPRTYHIPPPKRMLDPGPPAVAIMDQKTPGGGAARATAASVR
jgi:hypothetical protein